MTDTQWVAAWVRCRVCRLDLLTFGLRVRGGAKATERTPQ